MRLDAPARLPSPPPTPAAARPLPPFCLGLEPSASPFTSRPGPFLAERPPFTLYLSPPYKNQVSLINSFPS